jgi:hypothetical protein
VHASSRDIDTSKLSRTTHAP